MKRVTVLTLAAFGIMVVAPGPHGFAQSAVTTLPGYVEFDMKSLLDGGAPQVEVNLPRALLIAAAAAVEQEQPDLSNALRSIELLRVQVYERPASPPDVEAAPPATADPQKLEAAFAKLQSDSGWLHSIKLQEEGKSEAVNGFIRIGDNGNVHGLAVFVSDLPKTMVFVNLIGDIDPEVLGKVVAFATQGKMDLSQFGGLLQGGIPPAAPPAPPAPAESSAPSTTE